MILFNKSTRIFCGPKRFSGYPIWEAGYRIWILIQIDTGDVELSIPEWHKESFFLESVLSGRLERFTLEGGESYLLFQRATIDVYPQEQNSENMVVILVHDPEFCGSLRLLPVQTLGWKCEVVGEGLVESSVEEYKTLFPKLFRPKAENEAQA